MEFIAMLLLAPLIWSSTQNTPVPLETGTTIVVTQSPTSQPRLELADGRFLIYPPKDRNLTMTVFQHSTRGPASLTNSKMIEVIVSAP